MPKIKHLLDKLDNAARRIAYHGSPHDFAAERLVRLADGTEQWIVGKPGRLPDVPAGAEVLKDAPLGRFRLDKMGTGEGAQAYGAGAYLSDSKPLANSHYRHRLTEYGYKRQSGSLPPMEEFAYDLLEQGRDDVDVVNAMRIKYGDQATNTAEFWDAFDSAKTGVKEGALYTAEIPHESLMLDWDKPLSEQPEVLEKLRSAGLVVGDEVQGLEMGRGPISQITGEQIVDDIAAQWSNDYGLDDVLGIEADTGQEAASRFLQRIGIPGTTYIGGTSGERNFVLFDENAIDIKEKGLIDPMLLAPVAAAAGIGLAAQNYDYGTPELDAAYRAYEAKRAQKRDIWRALKDSIEFGATLGSAIGGGIIADASRLGGYLNPFMSTQDTEQGAQAIENNLQYVPSQPNAMLESFGRNMNQFSQDIEPLAAPFRQSIPYKAYEALPERAKGIVGIAADYAF
jgi:hypothetical protein